MLILLVESGADEARGLAHTLAAEPDVDVEVVRDGPAALHRLAAGNIDAVVTDYSAGPLEGIELVRRIRQQQPRLPLVILTSEATVDRAVTCMRAGATDFLPRPVDSGALARLLRRAIGEAPHQPSRERGRLEVTRARDYLAGDHSRLDAVRSFAERVARVPEATVLITGESGTGKSCLARAIHALSGARGRFVEVACATLPPSLIESELFGHERGAFTDARVMKRGLVETAAGGTLFLDEIGSLPLDLQAKLLVFLESRQIRRIGGTETIPVSIRIITAANQDLQTAVRQGSFRADLLYRLDVAGVHLPPLREMPEIIGELTARFAGEFADQLHQPKPAPMPGATQALLDYAWPGNVRELRNAVERALIFHDAGPLLICPPSDQNQPAATSGLLMPPGLTLDEVQRRYLLAALQDFEGDYAALAARLGISRKTLWEKRRRLGLSIPVTRDPARRQPCT
jgi:DNA-binding NtrC family response regulator